MSYWSSTVYDPEREYELAKFNQQQELLVTMKDLRDNGVKEKKQRELKVVQMSFTCPNCNASINYNLKDDDDVIQCEYCETMCRIK